MNVKIKKLSPEAVVPSYQTFGSSGFDFHSAESLFIMPGETKLVDTGLAFEIPHNVELQVRPRSGLSAKTGIRVSNSPGTVDADFRGSVKIILTNTGLSPFTINQGDRVAQGVFCPIIRVTFGLADDLGVTERMDKGFGSTGGIL